MMFLMLAQRLRRWPNIKTSSFQRVVSAGKSMGQWLFRGDTGV